MATAQIPEEQLIELLVQLKRAPPDQARSILNSQPQIAYSLITLMVKMNAINIEVLEKTLTAPGSRPNGVSQVPPAQPVAPSVSAVPPHIQAQTSRVATPQYSTPPPIVYSQPQHQPVPSAYPTYGNPVYPNNKDVPPPQPNYYNAPAATPSYAPPPLVAPSLPPAFAAMPEEQKAMIMQVINMTPDQINRLPPTERASIIQLRATLGIQ
ncbi:hypothetical protein BV25DRAFT_1818333 [Artomyces pyxidatus]|uniref:Uncharacterized protein n=1 Tax=Artomyces pyxidatus TaxID=48021 RepID=A0ACB8THT4_9AGAM|nr:hypothetical protein BV25DRAFT_1818333 [Artomyces pyxidatus]